MRSRPSARVQACFGRAALSLLPAAGDHFAFVDAASATDQPSRNLYNNLHAARPELYAFAWVK